LCGTITTYQRDVWPKHFAGGEYERLRGPMNSMLNAQSQRACDKAFEAIREILRSDSEKLQYVCDFYEHPEQFAPLKINLIEGSLQRLLRNRIIQVL
jgi:hypothetical protein